MSYEVQIDFLTSMDLDRGLQFAIDIQAQNLPNHRLVCHDITALPTRHNYMLTTVWSDE